MNPDLFADIGTRNVAARETLSPVLPPVLPPTELAASIPDAGAAFTPKPKMSSPEELASALVALRAERAPFLADLAPMLAVERIVQPVKRFQWRMETPADLADFAHTTSGAGQWDDVTIPHYGGPVGRARAYYRTTFDVTADMIAKGAIAIHFEGVDYKAEVFVNGHHVGSHEGFFGPFEVHCLDVVHEGENLLLVRVENDAAFMGIQFWGKQEEGDKLFAASGLGWDDPDLGWRHSPPGFGIYRWVTVEARAPLHVADLFVRTLTTDGDVEAWVEVWSNDRANQAVSLELSVFGQNFEQTVIRDLQHSPVAQVTPGVGDMEKPTDNQQVPLTMGPGLNVIKVPLTISDPRLWDLDTPWLYQLQVKLLDADGAVIDTRKRQFGIRTFTQDVDNEPRGRFILNGREIKLRGANSMGFEQQDVFTGDLEQLVDDILLAKIANMNYLRLTQRPVEREVYEHADRLGLLTQTDLPLFGCLRYSKFAEAVRQSEEMERFVRGHACNVVVSFINEPFPNAYAKPHRHLTRPDLQGFFEAAERAMRVLNPDRVFKHVDGDYDPPGTTLPDNHCYSGWYNGHGVELGELHRGAWIPIRDGWAYGCGEFGSEGLDNSDLMRRRYPADWLPQGDESDWWPSAIPGSQTGDFHYMWFDTQHTVDDWVDATWRHQAWITRMFAERFRRDNRMVSFAIHLFIDAFPASWMKSIMDVERQPKPAYFAYRDALEPLTVSIRTDRWKWTAGEPMRYEFWVANDTQLTSESLTLRWQLEDESGTVVFAQQGAASVSAVQSTFQGFFSPAAPEVDDRKRYTVRLALCDGDDVITDTAVEVEVLPRLAALPSDAHGVRVVGSAGLGTRLLDELGAQISSDAATILVDDYAAFDANRAELERAVSEGARLVFLDLSPGSYDIAGGEVGVRTLPMQSRQFVSRATGHPLVDGFEADDFKCWYEPEIGGFTPILATALDAPDWSPILTSGRGEWMVKNWMPVAGAAEKKHGAGSYLICQLSLAGRMVNPTAERFARRLLSLPD